MRIFLSLLTAIVPLTVSAFDQIEIEDLTATAESGVSPEELDESLRADVRSSTYPDHVTGGYYPSVYTNMTNPNVITGGDTPSVYTYGNYPSRLTTGRSLEVEDAESVPMPNLDF